MRVIHLIPTLQHGGAERQLRQLLPVMAACGVDVAVLSRVGEPDSAELRAHGVTVVPIKSHGNYHPGILQQIHSVVQGWRPDLIQTWLPMMDILGGFTGVTLGVPFILSERCEGNFYARGLKTSLRLFAGRRAAAIVANSPVGADYWRGHPNVSVIPNGIDARAIAAARPRPVDHHPIIVCVARLSAQKNHSRLIEAMAVVRRRYPSAVLQLLGEGPDRAMLEHQIHRLGLNEAVEFAGFRADAWSWLKAADVAILVSHYEGTPNAALEAAVVGCPIVLSDIPAHRAAFSPEEAIFVTKDCPDVIAAGIIELLSNRSRREVMTKTAARRVAPLTVQASAEHYVEIYERILKRRKEQKH